MDEWQELEDAVNKRELERQRESQEFWTNFFIDKIEKEVDERATVLENLEPWKYLDVDIQKLSREWGKPVADALQKMALAYWNLNAEYLKPLNFEYKLIVPNVKKPPQIHWRVSKRSMWVVSSFIVNLVILSDGTPENFEILVREERKIITAVELEALKAGLVEAFHSGSVIGIMDKSEPGISLDL